jgi:hypothetical protein
MVGKSLSGTYGDMPIDMYLKKMEQTCMFEDDDQIMNYQRQTLKDLKPDKPFFESDQTRRDNHSGERLNLRYHGKTSELDPYLPEGSFIDYQFLEKDPRSISNDPNMQLLRQQQMARSKFYNFYPDHDKSVVESGRSPYKVMKDVRAGFGFIKDRLKIFDESYDSRHAGGTQNHRLMSTGVCLQTVDERTPNMKDEICYNRSRAVDKLSNNTPIGWRLTTDHRFKVSHFGRPRSQQGTSEQNWFKNRANTRMDHDIATSWQENNALKTLTIKMIDLSNQKHDKHNTIDITQFKDGLNVNNTRKKLHISDISSAISRKSHISQPLSNIIKNDCRNNSKKIYNTDNVIEKAVIDPIILRQLTLHN